MAVLNSDKPIPLGTVLGVWRHKCGGELMVTGYVPHTWLDMQVETYVCLKCAAECSYNDHHTKPIDIGLTGNEPQLGSNKGKGNQ